MPTEKGIPKPPEVGNWIPNMSLTTEAWRWISRVFSNYPKVQTFEVTINPTSVSANTTSVQTFSVTGLTVNDRVLVNKPTHTAGLAVAGAYVSAVDTLAIVFGNFTGLSIDPPSETYRVCSVRL